MVWPPGSTPGVPLSRIPHPRETYFGVMVHKKHRRLYGTETIETEKALWQGDPAGEIPSRRGEIIVIVIIITLDFIGIIITIISASVTIISTAPLCTAVTTRVESCLVHRGNFPGVNYSLWLMLLSFIGELRFMSRLLFIIISPLIMILMRSEEPHV